MYKIITYKDSKYITIPKLSELGLNLVITTSTDNMRLNSDILPIGSIDNYNKIFEFLNINPKNIFISNQKHTTNIKTVEKYSNSYLNFIDNNDGFITTKEDIALVSLSADCTPIVFYDKNKKIIANVHSGWKGTLNKIGSKALATLINDFNSNPMDIIVLLGPSISYDDFEVEEDVLNQFKSQFDNIENYYRKKNESKYLIDLDNINIDQFVNMGVDKENIINISDSSFSNDLFHSYRRDKPDYKLMATIAIL